MPMISVSRLINPSSQWTFDERVETARCIQQDVLLRSAAGKPLTDDETCDAVTRMLNLMTDDASDLEKDRSAILNGGVE